MTENTQTTYEASTETSRAAEEETTTPPNEADQIFEAIAGIAEKLADMVSDPLKANKTAITALAVLYKLSDAEERRIIQICLDVMLNTSVSVVVETLSSKGFKELDVATRGGIHSGLFTEVVNLAGVYDSIVGDNRQERVIKMLQERYGDKLDLVHMGRKSGEADAKDTD